MTADEIDKTLMESLIKMLYRYLGVGQEEIRLEGDNLIWTKDGKESVANISFCHSVAKEFYMKRLVNR